MDKIETPRVYVKGQKSEAKDFVDKLPVSHKQGDECSLLQDGSILRGPLDHETQMPRSTRMLFNDRVTIAHLDKRSIVYVAVPDWTHLENDWPFFKDNSFDFVKLQEYFKGVYRLILASLLAEKRNKLCLRLWPLVSRKVVSPSVLQQFSFAYASALIASLDEWRKETSLIESICVSDFLDIPAQSIVYFFQNENQNFVPIRTLKKEDMWDLSNRYTEIVSSDSFCVPGMHPNSLEHTFSQDTNYKDVFGRPWTVREIGSQIYSVFNGWPTLSMSSQKRQHQPMDAPLYRNVSNRECALSSTKAYS